MRIRLTPFLLVVLVIGAVSPGFAQEGGHYDENVVSPVPVELVYIRFSYDQQKKARVVHVRFHNRTDQVLRGLQLNVFQGTKGPTNWQKGMKWTPNTYTPKPAYVAAQTDRFDVGANLEQVRHLTFERPQINNLKTVVVQFRWYQGGITSWSAKTFPVDITRKGLNRCQGSDRNSPDVDIVGVKFGKAISSRYNQSAIIKLVNRSTKADMPVVFRMQQRGINGEWLPVGGPQNYFVRLKPGEMKNIQRQFNKRPAMAAFRILAHKQGSKKMAEHIMCFQSRK